MSVAAPDWVALATALGTVSPAQQYEAYSSEMAPLVLDTVLGQAFVHDAVDTCLSFQPGWGLAEQVLIKLESWIAMQYCFARYQTAVATDDRSAAAGLLGTIGNWRAAAWIPFLLADTEHGIQQAGMKLLRRWMHYMMDDPAMLQQLAQAEQHPQIEIQGEARRLRAYITYATTFDREWARQQP